MPEPTIALSPDIRRFLTESRRHAAIATVGPDGAPHQAVIWYRLEPDGTILVNSRTDRRWPSELQRDPRIALTVLDPEIDAEAYVTIQAEAEVVATGDAALADIQALARRYGGDPGRFEGQSRISFRLRPVRVIVHGELIRVPAEAAR